MRITVACPESMISDANHLAMALAFSEADGRTFGEPNWKDADGNLYACASLIATDTWIAKAQSILTRPEWDKGNIIDAEKARRVHAALVFSLSPVLASPKRLTAIGGIDGLEAIAAMGLASAHQET